MNIRSITRQIAKARMKALGIDKVSRKMGNGQWRKVIDGEYAASALNAQIGRIGKPKSRRKLKKVSA